VSDQHSCSCDACVASSSGRAGDAGVAATVIRRLFAYVFVVLMVAIVGCAPKTIENIPRYPLMDPAASLATMRDRANGVRDISGQGAVTLTDARGGSVRLDAAFVFAPPDRARVRTYKFGQAVLDLTVTPNELWLFVPRKDERADQLRAAAGSTGRAVRQWLELLAGGDAAAGGEAEVVGDRIVVMQSQDGLTTRSEIDRATLTARKFMIIDSTGKQQFTLTLTNYRQVGPAVWPSKIRAVSPTGTIDIESRDVEANVAPPAAFTPPARAERLP
jgi:outer membrane lipoprotein-sorting protein